MPNRLAEFLKQSYVTRTSGFLDVSAKTDLFNEISALAGGTFTKSHTPGNILSTLKITIPYKHWVITLSESDTRPLKFEIAFEPLVDFEFVIGIEDFFDKFLERIIKTEIKIGEKVFDNQYLIHSNDPVLTGKILIEDIRSKILKHNLYNVSYFSDSNRKGSELISAVSRTVEGKDAYLDLITLHQMLIDKLVESGVVKG